jgi:hypothetical protein
LGTGAGVCALAALANKPMVNPMATARACLIREFLI